jgi:EmrB/QacA subfamily drug resistance transporter
MPTTQATQSTKNAVWILLATTLASSMAFIDGTVVNIALPALQSGLHATASDLQWVVESYALLLASLLLLGGSLGDTYGRRKIFILGVVIFAASSAWCGLARTIDVLIFARGVQGIGAAFLLPGSLSIITASFSAEERGHAIGLWSGFTALTAAIGPVCGGWLVEHASWRWVFFLNVPIALIVIAVSCFKVPESRNREACGGIDWLGAALATVGFGGITYALIEAQRNSRYAWPTGAVGLCALVGFLLVEAKSSAPMVSLKIFRSRTFVATNLITLFLYAALSGLLFFLPLDLIQVEHYTATQAGGALLPIVFLLVVLSHWSGGLIARYGARVPLTIGPLIAAVGFALLWHSGLTGTYWRTFFPAGVFLGTGMALSVAPLTTAVMGSLPESSAGIASGVNNAVSRLASLLAVAVLGLVLIHGFNRELTRNLAPLQLSAEAHQSVDRQRLKLAGAETDDPRIRLAIDKSFVFGFHEITWIAAALSLLSALSAQLIEPAPQR